MFVTPLYASLLVFWFVVLSVRVVNLRRRGIIFGDNGDLAVTRVVRAQANFAEYVPLALLLMARVVHGLALSFGWQMRSGRVAGTALTFIVLLIEAFLCLYQGLRGQWVWWQ
jgi:uncharacterized membrane protein YecN with MAPEG domain